MCLSDSDTVSTEDGCWVVLICHVVDEDRVPDIRINTSHIQREWSSPGDGDCAGITAGSQITHC